MSMSPVNRTQLQSLVNKLNEQLVEHVDPENLEGNIQIDYYSGTDSYTLYHGYHRTGEIAAYWPEYPHVGIPANEMLMFLYGQLIMLKRLKERVE